MQAIYETTCIEIIKDLSEGLVEDVPTNESYTSIHGLNHSVEEINYTRGIEGIAKKYHHPGLTRITDGTNAGYNAFRDYMDIMKVGELDMSINEAVAMAADIRKEAGTQFYGMLLMDAGVKRSKVAFNPLHPVIVSELIKEGTTIDREAKVWTLAVFSWKDGYEKRFKKEYPHYYNEESYAEEIATLIAAIDTPTEYVIENKNFNVDIQNDQFVLNYDQVKKLKETGDIIEQEATDARSYIIPGQLINVNGVGYPYYNTIYSTKGLAWNMSPMYGANVNHPQGQANNRGMMGGSRICTNSGDSKTQRGIAALNHCNTTSPLNRDCMEAGSMSYANQCIDLSLELLLGGDYKAEIVEKALTFQEFVAENDGASKAQYIAYIKNRMKEKVLEPTQSHEIEYEMYGDRDNYKIGDIVIDRYYPEDQWNHTKGRLRQRAAGGEWNDYIPPIDLSNIDTVLPGPVEPIAPVAVTAGDINWNAGQDYILGEMTVHNGQTFVALENSNDIEPGTEGIPAVAWVALEPTPDEADLAEAELAQQDAEQEMTA